MRTVDLADAKAWFVPAPAPDETLGSLLARVAAFYNASPAALWSGLRSGADDDDVDNPSRYTTARMASAIGIPARTLGAIRLPDAPRLLAPSARGAYCPSCWAEDDESGRPRGQRRCWTRALVTLCPVHRIPLRLPRVRGMTDERVDGAPPSDPALSCLWVVEDFAHTLESCLFDGAVWPSTWRGTPSQARAWILGTTLNLAAEEGYPLISRTVAPPGLGEQLHGPKHPFPPTYRSPWDAFRRIGDPAIRRAGVWIAAWRTCPEFPEHWSPWSIRRTALPRIPRLSRQRCVRALIAQCRGS